MRTRASFFGTVEREAPNSNDYVVHRLHVNFRIAAREHTDSAYASYFSHTFDASANQETHLRWRSIGRQCGLFDHGAAAASALSASGRNGRPAGESLGLVKWLRLAQSRMSGRNPLISLCVMTVAEGADPEDIRGRACGRDKVHGCARRAPNPKGHREARRRQRAAPFALCGGDRSLSGVRCDP
jgi:hypothetical protein